MAERTIDYALRIQADLATARAEVVSLSKAMAEAGKVAGSTGTNVGAVADQLDTVEAAGASAANTAQQVTAELVAQAQAATAAANDAEGLAHAQAEVAAASEQQASAQAEASEAAQQAAQAARALAETEDEAAARIRAVIAASRDQAEAEQSVTAAMASGNTAAQNRATSAGDVAAAIARQNAQMREASSAVAAEAAAERQAGAAAQDHAADLARLLAQIDPTIAALERLDQQEAELQRFRNLGLVDDESFARFRGQIEDSRATLARYGRQSGQTAQAMRQLPAQLTDIATGLATGQPLWMVAIQQGGQIKDSFGGTGAALDAIASKITPVTLGFTGLAAATAAVIYGFVQGQREDAQFNAVLTATNGYLGVTIDSLRDMQRGLATNGTSLGDARDALLAVANTGRFTGDELRSVAQAALDMARTTGTSVDQAVQQFVRLREDPLKAAQELDQQYHFLNETIYAQIQALQESGDKAQAASVLQQALNENFARAAQAQQAQLGTLQRDWQAVLDTINQVKDALLAIGRSQTTRDRLGGLQDNLTNLAQRGYVQYNASAGVNSFQLTAKARAQDDQGVYLQGQIDLYNQLRDAVAKTDKQTANDAAERQRTSSVIQTRAALDGMLSSIDKAAARTSAIQRLNDQFESLWKNSREANDSLLKGVQRVVGEDGSVSFFGGAYDKLLAGIDKQFADTAKTVKATDYSSAIAAQQQLIQSLSQVQGQLDPTAAAWAQYNDQVNQANANAKLAKTAPGANAEAIEAERQALINLYATARDKSLQKIADADRQAWEQLVGAVESPATANVADALAKIQKLNDLLAKGVGNSDDYHKAIQNIGRGIGDFLPNYRDPRFRNSSAVGNDLAQLNKNAQAQKDLDAAYRQQLEAAKKFQDGSVAGEEAYQARLDALRQEHADKSAKIDEARQAIQLQTASDTFGALATLMNSGNSRLFAIGKAAAIAQAIVQTYAAANKALAEGGTFLGPVLAAVAIATGLANVAQIRAQHLATGGPVHGPGTKTSDSVPVMASDGEYMHKAAAVDYYGLPFMNAVNELRYPRMAFASGGLISAPRLSSPTIRAPRLPSGDIAPAANDGGEGSSKHVHLWDRDQAAQEIAQSSFFQKSVLHVVGNNPRTIQKRWGK